MTDAARRPSYVTMFLGHSTEEWRTIIAWAKAECRVPLEDKTKKTDYDYFVEGLQFHQLVGILHQYNCLRPDLFGEFWT